MLERIQKLISDSGFLSRRQAEEAIKQNRVKVNGGIAKLGDKASSDDIIEIDNVILNKYPNTYLLISKPHNYIAKYRDKKHGIDLLLPVDLKNINFTILNPLRYNETGLMFLTNDKTLIQKFRKSNQNIKQTYAVYFNYKVEQVDITKLIKGLSYKENKITFRIIKIDHDKQNNRSKIDVEFEAPKSLNLYDLLINNKFDIKKTKRLSYHNIFLKDLNYNYRHLKPHEVKILFSL